MNRFFTSLGVAAQVGLSIGPLAAQSNQMNVLFIAVDDLKPVLGCYGDKMVKTPNIDRLARQGTVFMRNYCQQAVSGPTRASLMTGMRPDYTGVWDLATKMRDVNPDILSMPQYFISKGYQTTGIGKIYDPRCVDDDLDKPSWSIPYFKSSDKYFSKTTGRPEGGYQLPETKALFLKYRAEGLAKGLTGTGLNNYIAKLVKPSVECADVPDNAYNDGANVLHAKEILAELSKAGKPFFFAVGFSKPHLPFVAPKKYWDLYDRNALPLATYREKAKNGPEIGYHTAAELNAYSDIPAIASFSDYKVGMTLPVEKQKELIHGYYAATSFTDAQIGILLHVLDSLGLSKNTIIVLWGDHGWHLGDHNLWCKHTNFEQATHAPLIISAPFIKPSVTSSPSEFVDIFPTLCDLSGLSIPKSLHGKSLVPVMKDPEKKVKGFAVSQYPRPANHLENARLGWSKGEYMGYSIRSERYRYTVWMKDSFRSTRPFREDLVVARELYDYEKDPLETVNVADDNKYSSAAKEMHSKMLNFLANQVKEDVKDGEILKNIRKDILNRSKEYLAAKPVTVTASSSKRSAGGLHDFYSEGDYWWPDPAKPDGPYIQKDGQTNPDNFSDHRLAMIRLSEMTATLTSAWLITGDRKYADKVLEHLHAWFVEPDSRMNPDMLYAQAIWGRFTGRGIGLIDAYHLVEVARSAKILIENKVIPESEAVKIKEWFSRFLHWMTSHPYGIDEMNAKNNHGTCWVATASSMASLTGDEQVLLMCRERFKTILLPSQMADDGSFPLELKRTKPYGYSLFNMDAFCNIAQILSTPEDNLFECTTQDGKSIRKGMEFIYPFIADKSTWPFAKDIYIWEEWPVRQSCLLFAGLALKNKKYITTFLSLPANSKHPEVIRNLPVRHPVIWLLNKPIK